MIIKTYLNKADGIEVTVAALKCGKHAVAVYDIDARRYRDGVAEFQDRQQAIHYAEGKANIDAVPQMVASW